MCLPDRFFLSMINELGKHLHDFDAPFIAAQRRRSYSALERCSVVCGGYFKLGEDTSTASAAR